MWSGLDIGLLEISELQFWKQVVPRHKIAKSMHLQDLDPVGLGRESY